MTRAKLTPEEKRERSRKTSADCRARTKLGLRLYRLWLDPAHVEDRMIEGTDLDSLHDDVEDHGTQERALERAIGDLEADFELGLKLKR